MSDDPEGLLAFPHAFLDQLQAINDRRRESKGTGRSSAFAVTGCLVSCQHSSMSLQVLRHCRHRLLIERPTT